MDILTPKHTRWTEFAERLEGPEGCDFQEDTNGKITWQCNGGFDLSKSEKILKHMGGIDIPKTLTYFTEHGGHCDCEVLFNVNR